jgi:hypothetical protein
MSWRDPELADHTDNSSLRELLPSEWFGQIHSGSAAIEFARELLSNPRLLNHQMLTPLICMIAAELIFRVTGEQVAPSDYLVHPKTMNVWCPSGLIGGPLES